MFKKWLFPFLNAVHVQNHVQRTPVLHYINLDKQHVTLSEFASANIFSASAKLSEKVGAASAGEELKDGTPEVNCIALSQIRFLSAWYLRCLNSPLSGSI